MELGKKYTSIFPTISPNSEIVYEVVFITSGGDAVVEWKFPDSIDSIQAEVIIKSHFKKYKEVREPAVCYINVYETEDGVRYVGPYTHKTLDDATTFGYRRVDTIKVEYYSNHDLVAVRIKQ